MSDHRKILEAFLKEAAEPIEGPAEPVAAKPQAVSRVEVEQLREMLKAAQEQLEIALRDCDELEKAREKDEKNPNNYSAQSCAARLQNATNQAYKLLKSIHQGASTHFIPKKL
jgi:hypothetical protein